ncbi:choline ABC transporter permease subunit, partial [Oceanospirillum sp. HFRX-1_2]
MNWITEHKLPLGQWMEAFVDWLIGNAAGFFDAIAFSLEWLILGVTDLLLMVPAMALITLTAALSWWLQRSIGLVIFVTASLLLIANLGYWSEMIETLVLVLMATFMCVLFGIPLGIL